MRSVCILQDCDCHVAIHFFITYKNVCTNDNADYFVLGMFIRTVLGKVSMDLSLALSYCNQLPLGKCFVCREDTKDHNL